MERRKVEQLIDSVVFDTSTNDDIDSMIEHQIALPYIESRVTSRPTVLPGAERSSTFRLTPRELRARTRLRESNRKLKEKLVNAERPSR